MGSEQGSQRWMQYKKWWRQLALPRTQIMVFLVTLDVRNAFNSARWIDMFEALDVFQISKYLKRILRNYFKNRRLLYQTCEGTKERTVTARAAQGSGLGRDLCNLAHESLIKLEVP